MSSDISCSFSLSISVKNPAALCSDAQDSVKQFGRMVADKVNKIGQKILNSPNSAREDARWVIVDEVALEKNSVTAHQEYIDSADEPLRDESKELEPPPDSV